MGGVCITAASTLRFPTPQELLDLSTGLCCGELVNDVQGRLAVGVPHSCIDAALKTTRNK